MALKVQSQSLTGAALNQVWWLLYSFVVRLDRQYEEALSKRAELPTSHRITPDMVQQQIGKQTVFSRIKSQMQIWRILALPPELWHAPPLRS